MPCSSNGVTPSTSAWRCCGRPAPARPAQAVLRAIVTAFVEPVLQMRASAEGEAYALLVARELAYRTPEAERVLGDFFDPMAHAFIDALHGACPGSTRPQAAWAYQFALGALIHHISDHRVQRLSRGRNAPNDAPGRRAAGRLHQRRHRRHAATRPHPPTETCMSKRSFLRTLGLATLGLAISAAATAQQVIKLTVAAGHPPVFLWVKLTDEVFIPEVDKRLAAAGGKYKIDWTKAWGGTLLKLGTESQGRGRWRGRHRHRQHHLRGRQIPAAERHVLHALRLRRCGCHQPDPARPAEEHSGDGRCLGEERPGVPERHGARFVSHLDQVPGHQDRGPAGQEAQRARAFGQLGQGHRRGGGGRQPEQLLRGHQVRRVRRRAGLRHRRLGRQAARGGAVHHQGELRRRCSLADWQ